MNETQDVEKYYCRSCSFEIGEIRQVSGLDLLFIDDIPHRKFEGWCPKCGKPLYWHYADKVMEKIVVEEVKKCKKNTEKG